MKILSTLKKQIKLPLYRNSLYLILNSIVGSILGFVFWIIAARYYSANDVGLVTAILSAIGLLTSISKIGLDIAIIKYLPTSDNKQKLINLSLTIPFLLSVLLSIVYIIGIDYWSPNLFVLHNKKYIVLFIVFTGTYSIYTTQNNIFIAERNSKISFILSTLWAFLKIPLLLIFASLGLFGIFSSWGIITVISSILGIISLCKIFEGYRPHLVLDTELINAMLFYSFGNYIAGFLVALPSLILPIFLSNINPELSAFFYVAWMIAGLFYSIIGLTNLSLFAECSHDIHYLKKGIKSVIKFVSLLLLPSVFGIIIAGSKLLSLFGENYSNNAYQLLILFIITSFPYAINQIFITINRVKMNILPIIYINAFIAICMLSIIYFLTNQIGLIAVGVGWLVAQSLGAIIGSIYVYRIYFS